MRTTRQLRGVHRRTSESWAAMVQEIESLHATTMEQQIQLNAAGDLIAHLSAERAVLMASVLELEARQPPSPAKQFSSGVRAAREVD